MTGENGETHQEQEKVSENDRLMLDMHREPAKTRPILEARERELVRRDHQETCQRNAKCMAMENSDADQRQPKQNEIDRHSEQ